MINSTAVGGGVAEILNRLVPLMKELGIEARRGGANGATPRPCRLPPACGNPLQRGRDDDGV
jgi:hypothetical protein